MKSLWRFVDECVSRQSGQGFLWMPVMLAFGVAFYFSLLNEPSWIVSVVTFVVTCTFVILSHFYLPMARFTAWALLMISVGFASAQFRAHYVYTPILDKKIQPVEVAGTVHFTEILEGGAGQRIILSDLEIEDILKEKTPRFIRIKFRTLQALEIGDRVKVLAGLVPPSPPVIPGGFDFQRHMYFKGIGATGFAYRDAVVIEHASGNYIATSIASLRQSIQKRIFNALENQNAASVTSALMTGLRSSIHTEDKDAMRSSGLAHMLAISGLHIGLFSGVVFFGIRLGLAAFSHIALLYPIKKIAAITAIIAAIFYMLMAGSSIPTQRAVIMSSIVFFAIFIDRSAISMRLVACAALFILIIAPESLVGVSFQLSFAAVAALVAFYEWTRPWWRSAYKNGGIVRRAVLYVLGVLITTTIATIATAPFALYHFQQVAAYGLLGNMLAMPILSFVVMPFIVASYILMPLGLEGWSLYIVGLGCEWILNVAHYVSNLNGAIIQVKTWPIAVLITFSMAFVFFLLLRGRTRFFIGGGALLIVIWIIIKTPHPFFLISSNAKLMAYYDENQNMHFNALNKEYFTRDVWLRSYGINLEHDKNKWPKEGGGIDDNMRCGEQGCRIKKSNIMLEVLEWAEGIDFVCHDHKINLIVVRDPVYETCNNVRIIDFFDIYNGGAHAIYYSDLDQKIEIHNVNENRGNRFWVSK